jgi:hypothetical protein
MTLTPEEGRRLHVLTLLGSSARGNADELSAPPCAPNGVARGGPADIFTDP